MNPTVSVLYAREQALDAAEFRRVLVESGLGEHRPIGDAARLHEMLTGANLVITARLGQPDRPLVGVARGVTDFCWCCYVSEVAVSKAAQGLGIGQGLLDEARRQIGPRVTLMLASYPNAIGFYERVGMTRWADTFMFKREY